MARLEWAVASDRTDLALSTLGKLSAGDLTPTEVQSLDAWFARRRGDRAAERVALDALLELEPASPEALERRADLEYEEGQPGRMEVFRLRKAEIDRIRERYRRLVVQGDPAEHCGEAAQLAHCAGPPVRGPWVGPLAAPSGSRRL